LALREAYRKARIKMTGLKFFVIEPPDPNYPYDAAEPSRIDICDMRKSLDRKLLQSVSEGAFLTSIWVNNWNAFAHIAAVGAELVWEDDRVTYRSRPERHLPGERIDIQ
jgi:hypothetical protein